MEDGTIAPKLKFSAGGTDTSPRIFGLVDDVAGNFADEFATAKVAQETGEKVSKGEKKTPNKEAEKAENKKAEAKETIEEETSSGKVSNDEAIVEKTAAKEEAVLTDPSFQINDIPAQEAPVEEIATEEAVNPEEIVEENPVAITEDNKEPLTNITDDSATDTTVELVEQDPIADDETVVDEEAVVTNEKDVATEEVTNIEAPVEEADEQAAALTKSSNDDKVIKAAKEEEKSQHPTKGLLGNRLRSEAVTEHTKNGNDFKAAEITLPQQASEVAKEAVKEAIKEAPIREGFHDIVSEKSRGDQKLPTVRTEQQQRVLQGLQQVAAETNVLPPAVGKVSPQLLEGLKVANAELARQVESAQNTQQQGQALAQQSKNDLLRPAVSAKPAKGEGVLYSEKFEEMKEKVVKQVGFKLKTTVVGKAQKLALKLHPKYLGTVDINLTMEEGSTRAQFIVDNQTVKELLHRSVDELQRSLRDQGIDVDTIEVDVADQNTAGFDENGRAWASAEDQKIAREWLASFHQFGGPGHNDDEPAETNVKAEEDNDQVLNILI